MIKQSPWSKPPSAYMAALSDKSLMNFLAMSRLRSFPAMEQQALDEIRRRVCERERKRA